MEKYTVFMDWKNQHCQNGPTTQSNLHIQCNPYQATNGIFHRTRTINFTICMEIQKTSNSQSNLEKEVWNLRNQPAWLQTILQSHRHQDSVVLAQRPIYRSMIILNNLWRNTFVWCLDLLLDLFLFFFSYFSKKDIDSYNYFIKLFYLVNVWPSHYLFVSLRAEALS